MYETWHPTSISLLLVLAKYIALWICSNHIPLFGCPHSRTLSSRVAAQRWSVSQGVAKLVLHASFAMYDAVCRNQFFKALFPSINRRRVLSDARRPTCQRCETGAITCLGYERPTVFIDQTKQIKELVTRLPSKVVKTHLAISQTFELGGMHMPSSVSIYHFHFRPLGVDFGDSFERQASKYDEVRAFMDNILSRHYSELSCRVERESSADLSLIPMLGTSAESIALYMCGKLAPDLTQVHQAFRLHGQTLDQLRTVISLHYHTHQQSVTASAPLLVVVMNMVLYEV